MLPLPWMLLPGMSFNCQGDNASCTLPVLAQLRAHDLLPPWARRWVAEQSTTAPKELWTDGVEDYLKYAKQLLTDFKDVLEGGSKAEAAPAPAAGGFGFGFGSSTGAAAAPAAPAAGSAKPPLAPGGLFGAGAGSGSQGAVAPASIFGALPSTGGAFTLGASGGGGFGGSTPGSAANSAGGSLFNVPSTGTLGSSFGTAATGADDDDGDEEAEQQPAEPSVRSHWLAARVPGAGCAVAWCALLL